MNLRWYQQEAKQAIYDALEKNSRVNPLVVLPTGSGKTPLIASICNDILQWGGRVCVVAHVKELLKQAHDKILKFVDMNEVGIYSAGLRSRDKRQKIICAGIQSVYSKPDVLGAFNVIVVDECHLIPLHDGGMYKSFIEFHKIANPKLKIIGMTATPYRLDAGYVYGPDELFPEITYEVGIKELIAQKYLCKMKSRSGSMRPDLSGIHTRGGEYIESEMSERMEAITREALTEMVELTRDRHKVLIFASSVQHGKMIHGMLSDQGHLTGFVCGKTGNKERNSLLCDFRTGPIKYLVNVNVLTTGFDAPNIDAIVLLRATLSPGLYYQICGRGLRISEQKSDCIVLDYGENALTHGPIDAIRINKKHCDGTGEAPSKECPECHAICFASVERCPECDYEFPKNDPNYKDRASDVEIISAETTTTEYDVKQTRYYIHTKRDNPDAPKTLRIEYETGFGYRATKREWVCFSHHGFAREKAVQWWRQRSCVPVPKTTEEAHELANSGALADTRKIVCAIRSGEKYETIVGYEIADMLPESEDLKEKEIESGYNDLYGGDDEIPF